MKLFEGGNVFKDADGNPLTQRINQTDVASTVQWLERLTGLDLPRERWLGSTGKTPTSGDLDMAIDLSEISKEELYARLVKWAQSHHEDPVEWVKKGGEVHFRTPITGRPEMGFVQTDFMFFPNLIWGIFYYGGGADSAYKGMHRNILLSSIAKQQGLKVGANGMFSRSTNQPVPNGQDPDYVAQVLLGPNATADNLKNVENIYAALAKDKDREDKLKDFKEHLARSGLQEPGGLQENDTNFLARLRDRIVNQGMLPLIEDETSTVYQLYEAKEPRIPYVEDLVFKSGLNGLNQALDIIKQSAENSAKYVTIKWDGSPALIFGRKPQTGEFVLTDKSGATAVGYDGLATSPQMISQIMTRRDSASVAKGKPQDRTGLAKMYADVWPYFEAAVPENFRGYVKGDLLYYPGKSYVENAGAYVFTPNTVVYRIPVASPLGLQMEDTQVGIAMHSQMEDPGSPEQAIGDVNKIFNPVPGLMITGATVKNLQNINPDPRTVKELQRIARSADGVAIAQLLKPEELRAMKITDLPALMEQFINSLKGTDYSDATPSAFGAWLENTVTPQKFDNIVTYLDSPKSNITGMAAAFTAWNLLHSLKIDLQRQLDLQQPGQEGWVMSTPAGRAKLVSRQAGGFASANTIRNRA